MRFVIRNKKIELERQDFEKVAKEKEIKGDKKTTYFAEIGGKEIPAKRLLYEVLRNKGYGLTLQDFTTEDAVRILRRLGIKLRTAKDTGGKANILKHAGRIDIGGNAIEDERKLYAT